MTDASIQSFKNAEKWREWLEENQHQQEGVWLQIFKNQSGMETVTYQQALEEAIVTAGLTGKRKNTMKNLTFKNLLRDGPKVYGLNAISAW